MPGMPSLRSRMVCMPVAATAMVWVAAWPRSLACAAWVFLFMISFLDLGAGFGGERVGSLVQPVKATELTGGHVAVEPLQIARVDGLTGCHACLQAHGAAVPAGWLGEIEHRGLGCLGLAGLQGLQAGQRGGDGGGGAPVPFAFPPPPLPF